MNNIYNKLYKILPIILLSIFSIILYCIFLLNSQDNDMYFEIVSGNDLLSGNFKTASHLDNFPMIVQQWLYSVCLAIFDKLGVAGHIIFVLIQNIILWSLSSIFIYMKIKNRSISMISSFALILFCHNYLINIRPQIITIILLVAELIFLEKYKENREHKYLFCIFPLLILAANFHQAVFLYHIIIILPYYFDKRTKWFIDWKLLLFTPFFIACTLLTPYGIDGSLYILRTFQSKTYDIINITELNRIDLLSYVGLKIFIILLITLYYIYKHKANIFTYFYIFLVIGLSFINARHISIVFIPLLFIVIHIDFNWFKNQYIHCILSLVCICLCIIFINQPNDKLENYGDIATVIEDKDAKICNSAMDLGGWLEYNGYTKIWIDSRCEAFSEQISGVPNVINIYYMLTYGYKFDKSINYSFVSNEELLNIIDKYDYIITNKLDYINRIADIKWHMIYNDDSYIIWAKN